MTNLNLSVLTTKPDRTDYLYEPASHTQRGEAFDIHKVISKLPIPRTGWVLPGYQYLGQMSPLEEQIDENDNPKPSHLPKNELDDIARCHDICYYDIQINKSKCD